MTEREVFTLISFFGMNLLAAVYCVLFSFGHPNVPLVAVIVACLMVFAGFNLLAFLQWLRCRRKPVAVLTGRSVSRRLGLVNLLGAVLLLAVYERGANLWYVWFVGATLLIIDAVIAAEYLWQRSYRARLPPQPGPAARKTAAGRWKT